jgi:hypothetical protein
MDHLDLVQQVKADLEARGVDLRGPCGAWAITSRVVWALRTEGAGALEKLTGSNCAGRAADIVCFASGQIVDILGDAGGANTPIWQPADPVDPARWRAPIDPGDAVAIVPVDVAPDAATRTAIRAELQRTNSNDDPAYWDRQIAAHGDSSTKNWDYWKGRLAIGDGVGKGYQGQAAATPAAPLLAAPSTAPDPLLEESQALGANGRRVFGMADSFMHLYPFEHHDYYGRLPEFLALNGEYGQYVQFCVFADTQIILPHLDDQAAHYTAVCDALQPSPNVLLQLVNENSANRNGIDLRRFEPPHGLLASIGSNGTGEDPPLPAWDYADLGSERRGDFALSTTTVYFATHGYAGEKGARGYPGTQRPTVVSEPPGFAEFPEPGRRTNDPAIAYLMGLGCRWGAGGTAHSSAGIQSERLPPTTRACVQAFLRGVRGMP